MPDTLQTHLANPRTPVEREIAELGPWFHNLHLPDGTQTAPEHALGDFPGFKWRQVAAALPERLDGWSVLDIGCNAGYYTFELARRGGEVTGIDVDPRYLRQARWAAEKMGLADRVRFQERGVYSLAREARTYDLVLFMGVFYHLRYPLLALDAVARAARRLVVFQTLTMPGAEPAATPEDLSIHARERLTEPGWPRMAFIEHRLAGDATNWWAADAAAVEAMLRSAGLRVTDRPGHEIYLCTPGTGQDGYARSVIDAQFAAAAGAPPAAPATGATRSGGSDA